MLTEEKMISLCNQAEQIAHKARFKVFSVSIIAYRFDDRTAISLNARRVDDDDDDGFYQTIYQSSTLEDVADAMVHAFESYLEVEG